MGRTKAILEEWDFEKRKLKNTSFHFNYAAITALESHL